LRDFEYTAPGTLREAVKLLAEKGDRARVMAGGTDLIVQMRVNRIQPDRVVDIKNIPEMNELTFTPRTGLRIGAAVSCRRIYEDADIVQRYPAIVDSAAIIGGIQIQGRASFGGNVCNSSPSADSIPTLIAYGATCEIAGPDGKRRVPVEEFCTGPGANVLSPGELLVSLRIPLNRKGSGAHYLRFIPRNEMDIAVVGVGAYVELGGRGKVFKMARISLAAVAPIPVFASEASAQLSGQPVNDDTIAQAAEAAKSAARPISDMRGTAEFRTHLVGVLVKRALNGAVKRARGEKVANAIEEA
jgi:carbon-monoxide dehydrogenase medium subunit